MTTQTLENAQETWPRIRTLGIETMLVGFGAELSEPANRAALSFRAAVDRAQIPGVEETSTSLVSTLVRFDPLVLAHADVQAQLSRLVGQQDWYAAPLPVGRRLWRIPTVFGTELAPQFEEAAALAGLTPPQAIAALTKAQTRVLTIGFAPGMPYLGLLPDQWNIPRQAGLTPAVPQGALALAIRQLVLFPAATSTGWRHVAQTAVRLFRPEAERPFVLTPGDEVALVATSPAKLTNMTSDPEGGATWSPLP